MSNVCLYYCIRNNLELDIFRYGVGLSFILLFLSCVQTKLHINLGSYGDFGKPRTVNVWDHRNPSGTYPMLWLTIFNSSMLTLSVNGCNSKIWIFSGIVSQKFQGIRTRCELLKTLVVLKGSCSAFLVLMNALKFYKASELYFWKQ